MNPIPVPWPLGLATLAAGAVIGSVASKVLADRTENEFETTNTLDIREKLLMLTTMREAEEISEEEYVRLRRAILDTFAGS